MIASTTTTFGGAHHPYFMVSRSPHQVHLPREPPDLALVRVCETRSDVAALTKTEPPSPQNVQRPPVRHVLVLEPETMVNLVFVDLRELDDITSCIESPRHVEQHSLVLNPASPSRPKSRRPPKFHQGNVPCCILGSDSGRDEGSKVIPTKARFVDDDWRSTTTLGHIEIA